VFAPERDEDLHYHCDRDITRLGRENDDLRDELAILKRERPRPDGKPRMTHAQRDKLWDLCAGYNVPFREDDYVLHSTRAAISIGSGYVEGWIGGRDGDGTTGRKTLYVGVAPDGRSHS
jgi:hypothetical protein